MEIAQFIWSSQTVEMKSDSEEEVFLTLRQSSFGNSAFGPSTTTDFCVSRPKSHTFAGRLWTCCVKFI